MQEQLNHVIRFIEEETKRKQDLIDHQAKIIESLQQSLDECKRTTEGNKQLINKLLGDITRLTQEIEWYKRTYESRSLLGVLKEKLLK
ncbi:hypothetical protein KJS94_17615 [Flavihumibacter rivuli]|uniref:hypothetical protein n=1 Tax=Flavihumibacter rivuli TaxID=2838156 RepID=UPI001BDF4396|nr:hypothetical protein [Flavihumibacter rivuli]ULQ56471.1 hypothetical protein KJS94_17615 [Flavihumibacter rivuli]